jgi:hypothetical protein
MATTRKPTKPKTSADLKAQLETAKRRLKELEQRAYAEELTELIKSTNIVADFAISDCQWVEDRDNIDGGNSSSDDIVDDNTTNKNICCGAVKNKHKEKSARNVQSWYY